MYIFVKMFNNIVKSAHKFEWPIANLLEKVTGIWKESEREGVKEKERKIKSKRQRKKEMGKKIEKVKKRKREGKRDR